MAGASAGRASLTAIAAGAALVAAGMTLDVCDFGLVPAFIIQGFLAVIAGLLLLGVAVLRAGVLLIVGALAILGFNDQNWQALMAVPFGFALVAVGYALWSSEPGRRPARAR